MNLEKQFDFWVTELPAFALAAVAAFLLVTHWLSWPLGLIAAVGVVLGLRGLGPLFKKMLRNQGDKP